MPSGGRELVHPREDDRPDQESEPILLKQLVHQGVVVPTPPGPYNLTLTIRGRPVALTPEQEEMALAWARKLGTPYVDDPVFVANFLADFTAAVHSAHAMRTTSEPPLKLEEIDFTPAAEIVAAERAARERMTREERKALAAGRKAAREALRETYGHAIVDGERTELGTYLVEPSSIFMGRGKHPLRGRWKPGPRERDITLNLSRDAQRPEGDWAAIVWEPESMWVARWRDRLSGKTKYIWLGDTAAIKQSKETHKFDQATGLRTQLEAVRAHIEAGLVADDPRRRMVATACYLIDRLCLRVGDEKDPDEADTVGATTLRPEHVRLHDKAGAGAVQAGPGAVQGGAGAVHGLVEFRFLGKDSVEWHRKVELPEVVRHNLAELAQNARPSRNGRQNAAGNRPQLFPDVSSRDVNAFLSEAQKGLTAKVFRTCHATAVVHESLEASGVGERHPEYRKREAAAQANLAAARLCNHYKKAPASWPERQARIRARREQLAARVAEHRRRVQECADALAAACASAKAREEAACTPAARERAAATGRKRLEKARQKRDAARERLRKAEETLARYNSQTALAAKARTWNLGTSLKSYIDPRVYHQWGQRVGYDVLACYYPKTLQRRFAWARGEEEGAEELVAESLRS
jgi:DNA topoisomerase-1